SSPGGSLKIIIPSGWSSPSLTSTDAGYFTVAVINGGVLKNTSVNGQVITLKISDLSANVGQVIINYGDKSSGGPGATAQNSASIATFVVETTTNGDVTTEILNSPTVDVSWMLVGNAGFMGKLNTTNWNSFKMYNGVPFVACSESVASNKVSVMKYESGSWQYVGTQGFSTGAASLHHGALAINSSTGSPYIVYSDSSLSNKAVVMTYTGVSWTAVGSSSGISDGQAVFPTIFIDNNTPYISFKDVFNSNKVTVMKYISGSWQVVGSKGFSPGVPYQITDLFVYSGIPYVSYFDDTTSEVVVLNFVAGSWQVVGIPFAGNKSNYPPLYINNGIPYIAFIEPNSPYNVFLMKYESGSWQSVGAIGYRGSYPAIAFDNNIPYIVFSDQAMSLGKLSVMKYESGNWQFQGLRGFTADQALLPNIVIYNGTPYVSFQDGNVNSQISVMKLE
ncbi:MAG TPA: hypothetical protein PLB12_01855, partial [Candidatus Goldiibacteriota bacterium]|nr:hypothetical protein [Candidatus Goldiibacteriota bacterium]